MSPIDPNRTLSPHPFSARRSRRAVIAGGSALLAAHKAAAKDDPQAFSVPVLCYHQFGEHVGSTLMVSTATLEGQLRLLVDGGFTVIPVRQLVERRLGRASSLPERPVALTIDDGYKSIYSDFFPLALKYRIPTTIFVYPSAISTLHFALTWEQIAEMQASGLIDVQSHSHTHPNMSLEEHSLSGPTFDQFIRRELDLSRQAIEARTGRKCDMLAWPYGIYDAALEQDAQKVGYIAAFGLGRRPATPADDIMALPRFVITESNRGSAFERIARGTAAG
jgi:peptidoglycan/xylan/chitin deacetylase (PgdA/CDA1 family)